MKQFNTLLLKWGLCVGMVLGSVTAFAEAGSGTGKDIEMYTFFPVPSVSYNNIYVTERFDVGTQKSPFTLTLGHPKINNDDIAPSLQLDSSSIALLKRGTASSKNNLDWNVDIYTNEATFGNYSDTPASSTASQLTFNNLFAQELTKSTDHPADEINAKKVKVNGKMKMISNAFPFEGASALPGCTQTVSWNTFTIGGNNRTFLECSEAPEEPTGKCGLQLVTNGTITCNSTAGAHTYCETITNNPDNALQALVEILPDSKCVINVGGVNKTWDPDNYPDHVFYSPHGGTGTAVTISTLCTGHFDGVHHIANENTVCLEVGKGDPPGGSTGTTNIEYWPLPICGGGMGPDDSYNDCTAAYHPLSPTCSTISNGLEPWYAEQVKSYTLNEYQINAFVAVCE